MMKFILIMGLLFNPIILFGQCENNYWLFGDSVSLSFDCITNQPTVGEFPVRHQWENYANINDSAGNLIMYMQGPDSLISYQPIPEYMKLNNFSGTEIENGDSLNTSFTNCRRSVEFMKYENSFNGNPHPNLSSFTLCTFKVDDNYPLSSAFSAHVTMWDVTGIRFSGCKFLNNMSISNPHISIPSDYGVGINEVDANFSVNSYCSAIVQVGQPCPSADLTKSEFRNLFGGITTTNAANAKTFNVNEAYFQICWDGIYTLKTDRFTVYNSTFDIGNNAVNGSTLNQTGINCNNGTGWRIEENIFNRNGLQALSDGVVIKNSGTSPNKVYRNTFIGLTDVGGYAIENNFDWTLVNKTGLEFLCNTFQNQCEYDIASVGTAPIGGIRTNQGENSISAGNCFSSNPINLEGDLYKSAGSHWFIYWYFNTGCQIPWNISPMVFTGSTNGINECPTNLGPVHGHFKTPIQLTQLSGVFNTEKTNYINLKQAYLLLIDGGNTEQLRDEVFFSVPAETWELYNELLAQSPNLSLRVALEAINREDVLPNSMLFELLYSNPDLLREDSIFIALVNMTDPMPEYLINSLRQQANETTLRTELESQIGSSYGRAYDAANDIVLHYMNDTIAYNADSINLWLSKTNTIENKYSEMKLMMQAGNFESATEKLNDLNNFGWNENTVSQNDRLQEYNALLISWNSAGKQISELDSNDVAQLVGYAESGDDNTSIEANGILNFFYGYNYYISVPALDAEPQRKENYNAFATIQKKIKLYPNPAQNFITVDWNIFELNGDGIIRIKNAQDQTVYSKIIINKSGQLLINTEDLISGIYLVSIEYNGRIFPVDKLTVIK